MLAQDARMSDPEVRLLLHRYRETGEVRYRNQVVEGHQWLAVLCARRMIRRSESLDDLAQVASIGVMHAAERFDPAFDVLLRTYASATVEGELRRHYRGTWRLRVSRGVQELNLEVTAAIDHLTTTRRSSPTLKDVAVYLGRPYADVVDAYLVGANHRPASLDTPSGDVDEAFEHPALGVDDTALDGVADRTLVEALLARLPPRERVVVELRFIGQLSQTEIGRRLGLSQAHVSRLLQSALRRMRILAEPSTSQLADT